MTNITILQNNRKPNWSLYAAILVIVVLVILWARSCSDRKTWEQKLAEKELQRAKEVDSIQKVLDFEIDEALKREFVWRDSAESNLAASEVYRYERDRGWEALGQSKTQADKLIAKIRELNGYDSSGCLELANNYEQATSQVYYFKNKSDLLVKKLDTAGSYQRLIINSIAASRDSALKANKATYEAYVGLKGSFDRLKPHGSVWGGASATVLPNMFLAGIEGAYQNKKGTQYQIGVGLDSRNVDYYVRATILWKVSFRKK